MKNILLVCCLAMIGMFVLSGCGGNSQPPAPTATTTHPPPTSTHTGIHTLTSTYTPTSTLTPTITLTPTVTQTPTITPKPTATQTPIPTLSSDLDKDAYVLDLIETNGGCVIPCYWGIEVGASTWRNVSPIFRPLISSEIPSEDYYFRYSHSLFDYWSKTFGVTMHGESRYVEYLTASYHLAPEPGWFDYDVAVKRTFSLLEILTTNGIPSRIYLGAYGPAEPGSGVDERLFLIYDELNFIIYYFLEEDYTNPWLDLEIDEFCFYEDWLLMITLYTASEQADQTLFEIARIQDDIRYRYVSDFREITGLEIEDFYDIVMSGEAEPCFQLVNP